MLCTYFFSVIHTKGIVITLVLQLLSPTILLAEEAHVFSCQQSECVSSQGYILNCHFDVVLLYTWYGQVKINISITFVLGCTLWIYPPYSTCMSKTKSLGGLHFFLIICPLQQWYFLTPKVARRIALGKISTGRSWVQGGEQSVGTSSSTRIALGSFNFLPRPTCVFCLQLLFSVSFLTQMTLICLS